MELPFSCTNPLTWSIFAKIVSTVATDALAAIPLKSIPMSRHLPEMPAECQTVQMCLPLTALALRWHCADFNCLFSWPWWRNRECSDPRDTKSESKIPSTLLTPLLQCGLLRTLSTLTFWSTMEVFPFHVGCTMPRSVNACISSVIVLPVFVSVWMIFNYHRYDFLPMNYEIVGECSPTNVATFECGDICGNQR